MGYSIEKNLTKINYTNGNNTSRIKYIVIHYFGSLGTAKSVSNFFKNGYRGVSAHYCVDDTNTIYQCVEDKDIAWHCGTRGKYFSNCRNSNSIGIEVKPYKKDTSHLNATDNDWYFNKETEANLLKLVADLCVKYNISSDNVLRHYDVTHKYCPRPYVGDDINIAGESGNSLWVKFKVKLKGEISSLKGIQSGTSSTSTTISNKQIGKMSIGSKVKLLDKSRQYNGKAIPKYYKSKVYDIKEISGDRVVLGLNGVTMYAVNIADIELEDNTPMVKDVADYIVKVNCRDLLIRSGPGTSCSVVGAIKDKGVYTITHQDSTDTWGKLKSGAGWIHLGYTTKLR